MKKTRQTSAAGKRPAPRVAVSSNSLGRHTRIDVVQKLQRPDRHFCKTGPLLQSRLQCGRASSNFGHVDMEVQKTKSSRSSVRRSRGSSTAEQELQLPCRLKVNDDSASVRSPNAPEPAWLGVAFTFVGRPIVHGRSGDECSTSEFGTSSRSRPLSISASSDARCLSNSEKSSLIFSSFFAFSLN